MKKEEDKNSFILYNEQKEIFDSLTDEQAGKLIKTIFEYEVDQKLPEDPFIKVVFVSIRQVLDKNKEKWEETKRKKSEAGRRGMESRWQGKDVTKDNKVITNDNIVINNITEDNTEKQDLTKITDNVNVNVNDINNKYILSSSEETSTDETSDKSEEDIKTNEKLKIYKKVIDYLNNKTNSNYKFTTKSTKSKINARLNEGYTLDDFIAVIDKKCKKWIGTEYEQYLRPSTLFGVKFEEYLEEKDVEVKKDGKKVAYEGKKKSFQNYEQREYSDEELESFIFEDN